ncbi:MAG: 50S ribosomal protein L23 [Clostridiales bacterium]|jgi:large subunit ribosomal protein L23|nr:50S ribosomal protein L23 [Clostridiales bacterium]
MSMNPYDIIKRPIITEKTMAQGEGKKYTFEVPLGVGKIQVKQAIEAVFSGVSVDKVNTMRVHGKVKRQGKHSGKRPDWKKAIVTLKKDSKSIEIFEG